MGRSAWYLVRQAAGSAALQGKYPRPEQRVAAPHAGAARRPGERRRNARKDERKCDRRVRVQGKVTRKWRQKEPLGRISVSVTHFGQSNCLS